MDVVFREDEEPLAVGGLTQSPANQRSEGLTEALNGQFRRLEVKLRP